MTAGLSVARLANPWLAIFAGTTLTPPGQWWVNVHTGDPGAAGTAATIASVPLQQVTWAAPAGGSIGALNTPTWSSWAWAAPNTLTHISVWDAATLGNFWFSAPVVTPQTVNANNNVALSTLSITLSPLAA